MRIDYTLFSGLIPKITPRNLPETASQVCQNAWLSEKDLRPIKSPLTVTALSDSLQKSIYLWRRGGSEEWLSWTGDVDVVRGPIADDQYDSIYYTDGTTLHRKRWIANAKVEDADVSMARPAAPIATKYDIVKLDTIQIVGNSPTQGGFTMRITQAASIVDNIVSAKASYSWNIGQNIVQNFVFTGSINTAGGSKSLALNSKQTVVIGSTTVGTIEMVSATPTYTMVNPAAGQYGWSVEVDIQISMEFSRQATQYLFYVTRSVDAYGQESPESLISSLVELTPNQYCIVSSAGRLYRSVAGTTTDDFFWLADGTSYTDFASDAQLAETMPLIENPPVEMYGLRSMPGGFLAAFNGKDLFFSEPYLPYSWPTRYRLTMDYDIVGLAVNGNDLIVLTTGNPYFISGTHPDIIQQSKMPVEQSCISKRSIAFSEKFVVYASPDGLCGITGGSVSVVTQQFYTREQWQALTPQDMIGSVHDGRYMGFISIGAIVFDFKEPMATLSTTDQVCAGVYCDLENDQLYMIQGSSITDWMANTTNLLATWRSKEYQGVKDAMPANGKIIAESYVNTVLKIFADDVLVWSYTVLNSDGFRMPKFDRSSRWSMQIETQDVVCSAILASSMLELRIIDRIKP